MLQCTSYNDVLKCFLYYKRSSFIWFVEGISSTLDRFVWKIPLDGALHDNFPNRSCLIDHILRFYNFQSFQIIMHNITP